MVSTMQAREIPVTRTDVLHILALNGDNLSLLTYEQKTAIRKIYFLDDDRSVEQRVKDGDLILTPKDIRDFYNQGGDFDE